MKILQLGQCHDSIDPAHVEAGDLQAAFDGRTHHGACGCKIFEPSGTESVPWGSAWWAVKDGKIELLRQNWDSSG